MRTVAKVIKTRQGAPESTDERTVGELACELVIPVQELLRYLRHMGVRGATQATAFKTSQAEQILRFVRHGKRIAEELDGISIPSSAKRSPIEVIVDRHGPTLLAMPSVNGVTASADLKGRPFVLVYAQKERDALPDLPQVLDGYPVLVELVSGPFTASTT